MNLRATLAILVCKAVRGVARVLRKGGTAKPGELALKICPDLLDIVSRGVDTVVVTGTNGKTTSCRMLEEAFAEMGEKCIANRSGANLMSGITTEFVMCCDLRGRCSRRFAVMECDEGWTKHVLPALQPKVFLVTNLFRDQVDRYGDVTNTLAAIRAGVEQSPDTVLCLNADDPVTASLAHDAPNPVLWYGLERGCGEERTVPGEGEITDCVLCGAKLDYTYINYAHLGGFRCPNCGYQRHTPDVAVQEILELGLDSSRVRLNVRGQEYELRVNQPAVYNISNAAGAVTAAIAAGCETEQAVDAAARFDCGFGRMEKFELGAGARMVLVKNAAGCNQVLEFLERQTADFALVMITNNRVADGTDISWIHDAKYEKLKDMEHLREVLLSGICADTMRARLLEAGLPEDRLRMEPDYNAITAYIEQSPCPVFITPSYTGMMEYRPLLVKRCGGKEFWE